MLEKAMMHRTPDHHLSLVANLVALRDIGPWLTDFLGQHPLDSDVALDVHGRSELAVHEIAVNQVEHAQASELTLCVWLENERLVFSLTDNGAAFAQDEVTPPDPDVPQVRGYGLHIVEMLAEDFSYERIDQQNRWWIALPLAG